LSAYELALRANAKAWESYVKADRALRNEAIGEAHSALAIDAGSTLALKGTSNNGVVDRCMRVIGLT
jgi:hypothetical protein